MLRMTIPSQGQKRTYSKERYARKMASRSEAERLSFNAERRDYMHKWRSENKVKLTGYSVRCRAKSIAAMTPLELEAFRKYERDKSKRLNDALKSDVFNAYGGWKCACCDETERSFLTMDHMQNNGSKLRREGVHGHSTQFYRWLKKSGYPKEFQVLCMNCQFGKRMNHGVCPHQVRCNDYPARE